VQVEIIISQRLNGVPPLDLLHNIFITAACYAPPRTVSYDCRLGSGRRQCPPTG
jgi:hypothetical protein